ncbi:MAG: hypothetical protein IJ542_01540 [Clostridia bacterium]|nr:hypothetical protein [Clostridia bacterium]
MSKRFMLDELNSLYGVDVSDCTTPDEKLEKLYATFRQQQREYTEKYGEMGEEEARQLLYKAVSTKAKRIEDPKIREELKIHVINAVKVLTCAQMGIDPSKVGLSIIDKKDDFESENYALAAPAHIVDFKRKFEEDNPDNMLASIVVYKDLLKMFPVPELMPLLFHECRHIQQIELEKQGETFGRGTSKFYAFRWLTDGREADADSYAYAQTMNIYSEAAQAGYDTNYLKTHKRIAKFVLGAYNKAHDMFAVYRQPRQALSSDTELSK